MTPERWHAGITSLPRIVTVPTERGPRGIGAESEGAERRWTPRGRSLRGAKTREAIKTPRKREKMWKQRLVTC